MAEQEPRAHQHRGQGHLDPRVEVSGPPRVPEELHRLLEVLIGDGPPVGPAHQRGEDALGAAFFLIRLRRLAHEAAATARRVPGTLRRVRAGDRDLVDGRRDAGMPVHVEMRIVRLTFRLEQ